MPEDLELKHDLEMVYLSSAYVLVREMSSLYAYYSLGESMRSGTRNKRTISVMTHLRNKWKLLNIVSALSSITFCVVASTQELVGWQVALASWTVGMLWLRMLGYIRMLSITFATYITCLLQIFSDIFQFLIIMVVVMLMFGSMIFIHQIDASNHDVAFVPSWDPRVADVLKISPEHLGEEDFDMHVFSTFFETLLTMYRTLLGESHRYWFHTPMEIGVYVIYELVVVILMLNVLIAVVGDSYEYSIIRARTTFVETRVELIVELETLGLTNTDGSNMFGMINKFGRRANRQLSRCFRPIMDMFDDGSDEEDDPMPAGRGGKGLTGGPHRTNAPRPIPPPPAHNGDGDDGRPYHLDKGLLGLLQWQFLMEDEMKSLTGEDMNSHDSWLGRALDMERRTKRIVAMSETNLEEALGPKVDNMQRDLAVELKKIKENVDVLMERLPLDGAAKKTGSRGASPN